MRTVGSRWRVSCAGRSTCVRVCGTVCASVFGVALRSQLTVYVPSSLSSTRARTTDAPRRSTRNGSPPLSIRSPAASNDSIVNVAFCLAMHVSSPGPLARHLEATASGPPERKLGRYERAVPGRRKREEPTNGEVGDDGEPSAGVSGDATMGLARSGDVGGGICQRRAGSRRARPRATRGRAGRSLQSGGVGGSGASRARSRSSALWPKKSVRLLPVANSKLK